MIRGTNVSFPSSPFPSSVVFDDVDPTVLAREDASFAQPRPDMAARGDAWRRYVERVLRPASGARVVAARRSDFKPLPFGG